MARKRTRSASKAAAAAPQAEKRPKSSPTESHTLLSAPSLTLSASPSSQIACLSASPDSTVLVSGCENGECRLYALNRSVPCFSVHKKAHRKPIVRTKFLEENAFVTAGADRSVNVWDVNDSSTQFSFVAKHKSFLNDVDCDVSKSKTIWTCGDDGLSNLYDLRDMDARHRPQLRVYSQAPVTCVKANSSSLYAGHCDGRISAFDVRKVANQNSAFNETFMDSISSTKSKSEAIKVVRRVRKQFGRFSKPLHELSEKGAACVLSLDLSQDDRLLALDSLNDLKLYDVQPFSAVEQATGSRLLTSVSLPGSSNAQRLVRLKASFAYNNDVVCGDCDGNVHAFRSSRGKTSELTCVSEKLSGHSDAVTEVVVTPKLVISGSLDGKIMVSETTFD